MNYTTIAQATKCYKIPSQIAVQNYGKIGDEF